MMREVGADVDALALHYYTIPDRKGAFGSGTDFDEATYARTFSKTLFMDELVTKHSAVMDKYDPEKRVNLAVDEWGILTNVVPGHGRRSLFMKNSLRDALLASLNRSEEHTSELQSLMRISYAVFCLLKKKTAIIP